jgi:hypothetical protein
LVARHVAKSSGCSVHSLWATPAAVRLADRARSWGSPFTSSTTWLQHRVGMAASVGVGVSPNRGEESRQAKVCPACLVHAVQRVRVAVGRRMRVVPVQPDGGHGRVAGLGDHTPLRLCAHVLSGQRANAQTTGPARQELRAWGRTSGQESPSRRSFRRTTYCTTGPSSVPPRGAAPALVPAMRCSLSLGALRAAGEATRLGAHTARVAG